MQFFIISHFFFVKISLDIKTCICFLEKRRNKITKISFLPSLKAKLLFTVCDGIPCTSHGIKYNHSKDQNYLKNLIAPYIFCQESDSPPPPFYPQIIWYPSLKWIIQSKLLGRLRVCLKCMLGFLWNFPAKPSIIKSAPTKTA